MRPAVLRLQLLVTLCALMIQISQSTDCNEGLSCYCKSGGNKIAVYWVNKAGFSATINFCKNGDMQSEQQAGLKISESKGRCYIADSGTRVVISPVAATQSRGYYVFDNIRITTKGSVSGWHNKIDRDEKDGSWKYGPNPVGDVCKSFHNVTA